jgi:hypothetical protein
VAAIPVALSREEPNGHGPLHPTIGELHLNHRRHGRVGLHELVVEGGVKREVLGDDLNRGVELLGRRKRLQTALRHSHALPVP